MVNDGYVILWFMEFWYGVNMGLIIWSLWAEVHNCHRGWPLVNVYIAMNNMFLMGKSTWLWPFSMAILNYQRVIVWLIHGVNMIGNVTLCKRFAISRVCQIMLNYKVGPRRQLSWLIAPSSLYGLWYRWC